MAAHIARTWLLSRPHYSFEKPFRHSCKVKNVEFCTLESQNKPSIAPIIPDVLHADDFFNVKSLVNIKDLFRARVHLGHKIGRLDDRMTQYIYGSRMDQAIIDLNQTIVHLHLALKVAAFVAYQSGIILFVNQSPQTAQIVDNVARHCGEYSHTHQYYTNVLTDSTAYFKTDVSLPSLIILLNTFNSIFETHTIVRDAAKMCIPTIGICDSDSDPSLIAYPVPGNDDTPSAIQLYCNLFADAIISGKRVRKEHENMLGVDVM